MYECKKHVDNLNIENFQNSLSDSVFEKPNIQISITLSSNALNTSCYR